MDLLPAEVLGDAIERLIGHCQSLDRDRTDLARALSRVQEEFVSLRAEHDRLTREYAELREHHDSVENVCNAVVERLECVVSSIEAGIPLDTVQDLVGQIGAVVMEDAPPSSGSDSLVSQPETQDSGLAVAERVVKPFDMGSFERIVRQAGGDISPIQSGNQPENVVVGVDEIESPGCVRDRLF